MAYAWRQVPDGLLKKSVDKCGFLDDASSWHISKHDVYGAKFRAPWEISARAIVDSDADGESSNELLDASDEVWIED